MKLYTDEIFLYTKKADISLKELSRLIYVLFDKYDSEQAVAFALQKELDAKIKRWMNKKFP